MFIFENLEHISVAAGFEVVPDTDAPHLFLWKRNGVEDKFEEGSDTSFDSEAEAWLDADLTAASTAMASDGLSEDEWEKLSVRSRQEAVAGAYGFESVMGYQIFNSNGECAQGKLGTELSGLTDYSVLIGKAVKSAQAWVEKNPGHAVKIVRELGLTFDQDPVFIDDLNSYMPKAAKTNVSGMAPG